MPSQSFLSNPQNNPYSMSLKLTELHFSGITGGGRGVRMPQRLLTGKILLTYRDKRGKEKMEKGGGNGEGKKENCKKEGGKWKMEGGKSSKMRRGLFFFCFFFFFFFCFLLSKRLKFDLGLPRWKFSQILHMIEMRTLPGFRLWENAYRKNNTGVT